MSILDDVKPYLTDGVAYLKDFAAQLEAAAPSILKYAGHPVLQALETAGDSIDEPATQLIVNAIQGIAALKTAAAAAAPAPAPAPAPAADPAQPQPAPAA